MTANNPFSWMDPGTWPGPVRVWAAIIVASWIISSIRPLWRWIRKKRSESRPSAPGKIESARVAQKKEFWPSNSFWNRQNAYTVEIGYSYTPARETYRGCWRKDFDYPEEAGDLLHSSRLPAQQQKFGAESRPHGSQDAVCAGLATAPR
jgi:hypothetical protein